MSRCYVGDLTTLEQFKKRTYNQLLVNMAIWINNTSGAVGSGEY